MSEYRKKLIEVALPLEVINRESAREKSIRHGHPSTLHLWWARRPLAACRAVLFAQLVDDPSAWLERFPSEADQEKERQRLFRIMERLVEWESSNNEAVLDAARFEIARSVAWNRGEAPPPSDNSIAVLDYLVEHAPPILDPFCGGGSIPLEAQRLGLKAYASDLNPVAVLITKALIEIPPKFARKPPVNPDARRGTAHSGGWQKAQGLAEDVRYYGRWMREEAEKRIGHLYPKVMVTAAIAKERPDLKPYVGKELTVIAWLWARTVASPNPACGGAHVPLVRSFWLSTKEGKEAWVKPVVDRKNNSYRFEVRVEKPSDTFDPKNGTVDRRGGTCLLSGSPVPFDYIREEGKAGRMSSRLMAIVAEGVKGRVYLPPIVEQEEIAGKAKPSNVPEAHLPEQALGFRVQRYGMDKYHSLFTPRQLVALTNFSDQIREAREHVLADARAARILPDDPRPLADGGAGPTAYADALAAYLSLGVSKLADATTSLTRWKPSMDQAIATFARQAIPMVWDYAESNAFNDAAGDYGTTISTMVRAISSLTGSVNARVKQLDATTVIDGIVHPVICTDPPYYDNIGYADLSDFFYIWLRRSLGKVFVQLFSTVLTPKAEELIASPFRHDGSKEKACEFFEEGLGRAFERMQEAQAAAFPLTLFYAFKQGESDRDEEEEGEGDSSVSSTGWETMLEGLLHAGFAISGTWPMRSELSNRPVASGTNALASSIVLVCRPRSSGASLATRKQFMDSLHKELPLALKHLQQGNIAPVDLAQAAIGPGMAIYSRYAKVIETDGSRMPVRTALQLINKSLDEVLTEQEGEFEPDTRWALAWFEQHGHEEGPYGVAETLSKAKDVSVNGLVEAGIVNARGGKVRLLRRNELPDDWDPLTDSRLTVWETTQHLIRALEQQGENGAAELLKKLGGAVGETARDLAYRLYTTCERKRWAKEALAYNSLVVAWPEITKLAVVEHGSTTASEPRLF